MNSNAHPSLRMTDEEYQKHLAFMREAILMAELALEKSETPVGCILVYEDRIISRGINDTNRSYNGTRHAEFIALNEFLSQTRSGEGFDIIKNSESQQARDDSSFNHQSQIKHSLDILVNCTLYVTVEPCIMCASLLRQFGIKRVFFGAWNDRFGGNGSVISVHRTEDSASKTSKKMGDYEVSGGWLREESIMLLRRFYIQENERAPEPREKSKRVLNLVIDPVFNPVGVDTGGS
ncbi:tRNA-specific adenosine deaminase subunit TAD2 [Erysiphe neolycopersici]|uniref:tRNA-specific adenosine deaminase subunit TAD2 n=1 Tax=Erysiphe neolycopersici TaxID=212602 RepID=A0A420HM59_9PEZI|nr:tRNA-specific adenosine deaminase subunit TAD2 [Erysiphe neolycopersici]